MQAQRPTGVTILAVLEAIGGILSLLGACTLLGLGALGGVAGAGAAASGTGAGDAAALAGAGALGVALGVVTLVLAIAMLVIAYGLWTLKGWAWMAALVLSVINVILAILQLLGGNSSAVSVIINIAISAIVIYYLMQPSVKQAFGRS